jgi:hypothetical protein
MAVVEINLKDFKSADKTIREKWPLYVVYRHDHQNVLEAFGCDTKEEVQEVWEELTDKQEGSVIVIEHRPGNATIN